MDLRIKDIEVRLVEVDSEPWYREAGEIPRGETRVWHFPLVSLRTECGIVGHTMGYGKQGDGPMTARMIRDFYAPRLIGQDVAYRERLWQEFRRQDRNLRYSKLGIAAMLDVGLWDIAGKAAGMPVARMLGLQRDRVPAYATASRFFTDIESMQREVRERKAQGYHGYKLQIHKGVAEDIRWFEAAREAAGADWRIMQDALGQYSYAEAIEVGYALDRLNFHWFEEPIEESQIDLTRELARRLKTPILFGETLTPFQITNYSHNEPFTMFRGDVNLKFGLTGLRKLMGYCDLRGLLVEIHNTTVPLMDLANLQMACAMGNTAMIEQHHAAFRFGLKDNSVLEIDAEGYLRLPEKPGLGEELDWDWVDRQTVCVVE